MKPVRLCYKTIEINNMDIHVRCLKDNQQFSDALGEAKSLGISSAQWSLFGIVWRSSEILANEMALFDIKDKRILEVGCGIALTSLMLNKRHADITATDIHPEAGSFLVENVRLNHGAAIPFLRTGWKDNNDGLGKFDVIVGSDILYERDHIDLLSEFINDHAEQKCEVIVVDPGRSNGGAFSKKMEQLGFRYRQYKSDFCEEVEGEFKGNILKFKRGEF